MSYNTGPCKRPRTMMIRLNNFLYVFNLRQGTILIAIHQLALSAFILVILMVGVSHVSEMLSILRNDMEDDAERRGLYEMNYGPHQYINNNNQLRFATAQNIASVTVIFFYVSTVVTAIYFICCISLLHGAVKYKLAYIVPWILSSCVAIVMLIVAFVVGDNYPCVVNLFGGRNLYHFACALGITLFIYAVCAVTSFAFETSGSRRTRSSNTNDERGERLLLLDHAANSSLMSAAQFNKMSHCAKTQFV